jgi:hypothetical protein
MRRRIWTSPRGDTLTWGTRGIREESGSGHVGVVGDLLLLSSSPFIFSFWLIFRANPCGTARYPFENQSCFVIKRTVEVWWRQDPGREAETSDAVISKEVSGCSFLIRRMDLDISYGSWVLVEESGNSRKLRT